MTTEQMKQLIQAAESGDDVRAVTLALAIAAAKAREGKREDAMSIKREVDHQQAQEARMEAHCHMRLRLVGDMFSSLAPHLADDCPLSDTVDRLVATADAIIVRCFCAPLGGDNGFTAPGYDLKPTKGDTK